MDSIAVTKPDMGVLGQNRTGLSPFGILSALFTRDILDRTEQQIGWYEYYGNWDFTGTKKLPAMTRYSYSPDGTPLFITDEGQGYLKDVREKETIWRLFFKAEETGAFTPVFEWYDGVEHIRVWKVEPLDKEDER